MNNMSQSFNIEKEYFHLNNSYKFTAIDIGHAKDSSWDITENYPYYSLNLLVSGTTIIIKNEQKVTVKPKKFFLIPPNTPVHYYNKRNDEPVEVYWINFYGENCKDIVNLTNFSKSDIETLPIKQFNNILIDFKETLELCKNENIQNIVCCQLLNLIFKYFILNANIYKNVIRGKKSSDFNDILSAINNNLFNSNLNAKFICDKFYITPERLSRIFNKNMNLHFSSYINNERIKKASTLLIETDYTLQSISNAVGYGDVYYFCKIFKKYRLMTPTEYRNMNNKK